MELKVKNIYELGLHEYVGVGDGIEWFVTRVPGGWIYESMFHPTEVNREHVLFIPYNNEFDPARHTPGNFHEWEC